MKNFDKNPTHLLLHIEFQFGMYDFNHLKQIKKIII
jgi:hypothetical protein